MQQSEKLTLANEYRVAVTCGRFMRMRFTLASGLIYVFALLCPKTGSGRGPKTGSGRGLGQIARLEPPFLKSTRNILAFGLTTDLSTSCCF